MIRILIDEGLTSYGNVSGIGHHMINLAQHLREITECEMTRYEALRKIPRYFRKWSYIGVCNIPALYGGYDLVHHLANYVPRVRGKNRHVLTIYDLSVFHYPGTISLAWRHYNAYSLRKSIERADALITISKSLQNEVLVAFPWLDKSRVFMCYPGTRTSILNSKPEEKDVISLNIEPFSYFLFIGEVTKRKNLRFALEAFLQARRQKLLDDQTKFVIVGKKSWGYSEVEELLNGTPSVKALGYLDDHQLAALYRYTKAFVYPSIYEGFGIPIVEAMSQNAPIIISNIPTSMELNKAHNNQMFSFELGDREGLIRLFEQIESESQSIRAALNYGSLAEYDYSSVAATHLGIYTRILNRT